MFFFFNFCFTFEKYFFLIKKIKGNNVKKESKFYIIFNTTCNENLYSDIV